MREISFSPSEKNRRIPEEHEKGRSSPFFFSQAQAKRYLNFSLYFSGGKKKKRRFFSKGAGELKSKNEKGGRKSSW